MKNIPKNKIVEDWLEEHGDPEIDKKVEKQLELEEAAEKYARKQCDDMYDNEGLTGASWGWETSLDFIAGAKWQAEKMYSEEEVKEMCIDAINSCTNGTSSHCQDFDEWFEQFKKK
jgi:hypothetical protein